VEARKEVRMPSRKYSHDIYIYIYIYIWVEDLIENWGGAGLFGPHSWSK
jgi:hypothetical protein